MALVNIPLFLCVRRTATAMWVVQLKCRFIRWQRPLHLCPCRVLVSRSTSFATDPSRSLSQISVLLVVLGAVIAGWETLIAVSFV